MTDKSMAHITVTPVMNEVDEFETNRFTSTFTSTFMLDMICLHLLMTPTGTESLIVFNISL
jgi:hypothetical protein